MRLKYCLLLVGSVLWQSLLGQKISFEKSTVDVGATLWRQPVTAVFSFSNKGREPLVVESVDAGCGCIDVKWTNRMLNKGEKGEIFVTYDAQLLGQFDRIINVHTNYEDKPVRIRFKGEVSQNVNTDAKNLFPYQIGDIMLSVDNIEFPDVHKGDSAVVSFEILNNGSEVYTPQLMHLPPYITAEYKPVMLGRGRRGVINLKLNSDMMANVGINQTNIYLARYLGDKVGNDNDIAVTSVLLPDIVDVFDDTCAPKLKVSSNVIDLGKLGRKSKLSGKIEITNDGTDELNLEFIAVNNQALMVSLPSRSLLPGKTMKMKVTILKKYLGMSNAQPRVLIITNDPKNQKESIRINYKK